MTAEVVLSSLLLAFGCEGGKWNAVHHRESGCEVCSPQQPWAPLCAGRAAVGRDWASGKAMFPSWMQMGSDNLGVDDSSKQRRGCDFALLLPRAAVLQGRGLWISQCTMDIAMALCFLNTELKGALYHVLLSWLQHRASAWLLAGGSTEPSGAEERISLLWKCKLLMGWIGWEKKKRRGSGAGVGLLRMRQAAGWWLRIRGDFFFLPLQDSAISYRPLSYPTSKTISSSHFSPWNICFYKN